MLNISKLKELKQKSKSEKILAYFSMFDKVINSYFFYIMNLRFQGDILNYKNIYILPFALSIESAHGGSQVTINLRQMRF